MARWTVEGSNDRFQWKEIVSFHGEELAQAAFDFEFTVSKWYWIRLVDPAGTIQERACTKVLK